MSNLSALIIAVTITFSPFAGIIAFLVTYDEYKHHFVKRDARKQALKMGLFSLFVFLAVGLISGYVFNQYVNH